MYVKIFVDECDADTYLNDTCKKCETFEIEGKKKRGGGNA